MADTKTGYRATAKWLMASPSKVRPVADLVRKRPYAEAIAILDNVPNKGAEPHKESRRLRRRQRAQPQPKTRRGHELYDPGDPYRREVRA